MAVHESTVYTGVAEESEAIGSWERWRRRPIVISFAQPWTSHLAVLAAIRQHPRLRWAAHFSDPWIDSPCFARQKWNPRDSKSGKSLARPMQ
jgi:hypothetical protein